MKTFTLKTILLTLSIITILGCSKDDSVSTPTSTVPGAPVIGIATAGVGQATVSFTAPANNGGSTITTYTATSSPGNISSTLTQAGSGTITVTGLTNGTAYTFTITATNAIGVSSSSVSSNSVTPTQPAAAVGDFRAGGVVFWVDQTGQHGLVCAIEDQSRGIQWYNGSSYITTGATASGIGTGAANTTAIIAAQGATETNYAAGLARAYTGGGYTNWFLPSKDELNQMYVNRAAINTTALANGGAIFAINYYWSSTEVGTNSAWEQYFYDGKQTSINKASTNAVRAVRVF